MASRYVESMPANLGGTSIVPPLMAIFSQACKPNMSRQLLILTDGIVDEAEDNVVDLVRQHSNTTRVFTFGIGNDVRKSFIKNTARATRGSFAFLGNQDELELLVVSLTKKALLPAWSNVQVEWVDEKQVNTSSKAEADPAPSLSIPARFICPISQMLMADPVNTYCGHMFDRQSLMDWLSRSTRCPVCNAALTPQQVFPCFPVKADLDEFQEKNRDMVRFHLH